MNRKMSAVMQRRGELLARIAAQREQLAETGARWKAPLALADQGVAVVRFLRAHPALVAGAVALVTIRRGGVMGLAKGGWRVWKGYRFLTVLSEKFSPPGH